MQTGRDITNISIHTSDSSFGDATVIRAWHVEGNKWADIGYHFVIKNGQIRPNIYLETLDGQIDVGTPLDVIPRAVRGHNRNQIAVCLIGKNGRYTMKQLESAIRLVAELTDRFSIPVSKVLGHKEYPNVAKSCPNLDMNRFRDAVTKYREEVENVSAGEHNS